MRSLMSAGDSWRGYEEWRKQELGEAPTRPHRITYRKLTR